MLNDKIIELGKGIKTNIVAEADLKGLARDAYEHGTLTSEATAKLIIEASERVAKATTKAAELEAKAQLDYLKALEENLKIKEKNIKANAAFDNRFNEGQIDAFKDYTESTMQRAFDTKKDILNEKAEVYYSQKELNTDKKFLSKDSEAEGYRLDKTLDATNKVTDFAKEATDKTQKSTLEAMEARIKAEEEKGLAEIEIKKWKLYKKTFKAFRWINYFFWPILGAIVGAVVAYLIMKINGYII